ncbi:MAG TPA: BPL-N domain-containing protein, partial [Pseudonocardia sp.]|nr:BPL-N domain-containing protein [Pseudonocardia sp.]
MRDRGSAWHRCGPRRRRRFAPLSGLAVTVLAVVLACQATSDTNPASAAAPGPGLRLAADSSEDTDPDDGDSSDSDSSDSSDDGDSGDSVRDNKSGKDGSGRPLALVYRNDPLGDSEDAADLAKMLRKSRFKFRIQYVGPKFTPLTADLLAKAALFAQPGGEVDTDTAKRDFAHEIPLVQPWVSNGGRFLGVCAGGFVAGKEGYGVFPGEVGSYVGSPNAQAKDDSDQAIQINWQGRQRTVDFQDGNYFEIPPGTP